MTSSQQQATPHRVGALGSASATHAPSWLRRTYVRRHKHTSKSGMHRSSTCHRENDIELQR